MIYIRKNYVIRCYEVNILYQAWDLQPENRPTFYDIKLVLGQLKAEYTKGVN